MSADRFTTTPEAAARFEADRTPAYDERADRYEPDLGPRRTPDDSRTLDELADDIRAVMSR